MGVQADQVQCRKLHNASYRLVGLTIGHGQSEFLVLMRRCDELVRMRFDPHGNAHQHILNTSETFSGVGNTHDVLEGIDDDAPDTCEHGCIDFLLRLVIAMQKQSFTRDTRPERHGHFPAGCDINPKALVGDPLGDAGGEECFRRVVDRCRTMAQVGLAKCPGPLPDILLVKQEDRRAERLHRIAHIHTGDDE